MSRRVTLTKWSRFALVLLVASCIGLLAYGLFHLNADWVPGSTTAKLRGASSDDVRDLLGEPTSINESDGAKWVYHRGDRLAEFQVWFGPDGRVEEWHYDR